MDSTHRLSRTFDRVLNALGVLAILLLLFVTLSVVAEVILRYFFGKSLIWVVQIGEYILLWIAFLGAAWVLKRDGHVRMDLVLNFLPERTRYLVNILTSLLGATICITLCWYSGEVTWDHFIRGAAEQAMLDIPKAPVMAIIPIGCLLLSIQFLRHARTHFKTWQAFQKTGSIS